MDTPLGAFEASLERCLADPRFLDRFYEGFLGASPIVREKFARTDFDRQKAALRASLDLMARAAREPEGSSPGYLMELARRHGARELAIGAHLYDLWLDCLIGAARQSDPQLTDEVARAWEDTLAVGIAFLCRHYRS